MLYFFIFFIFINYFIISIIFKEFYWTISGVNVYKYTGKHAIFLSLGFLILFIFFGWMAIGQNYKTTTKETILSFIFSVPLSIILRLALILMYKKSGIKQQT